MENNDISKKIVLLQNIILNLGSINNDFYAEIARLRDEGSAENRELMKQIVSLKDDVERLTAERDEAREKLIALEERQKGDDSEVTFLRERVQLQEQMYKELEDKFISLQQRMCRTDDQKNKQNNDNVAWLVSHMKKVCANNESIVNMLKNVYGNYAAGTQQAAEYLRMKNELEKLKASMGEHKPAASPPDTDDNGFSDKTEPDDAFSN